MFSSLGLSSIPGVQTPNYVATYLLVNWALAYIFMSPRGAKIYYGVDNNVSPREDLRTLGEAAVRTGRLEQRVLDKLKREEAAQANTIEGFSLFVASILSASFAGVPAETVNTIGIWYTVSRVAFSLCYSHIQTQSWSYLRSAAWWSSHICCATGLVLAARCCNQSE
ncbi:Membrane-associated eicosanoid/glutathione metabolism (MAPEG) protein [Penicillium malachiteum]|uniref:Membrane-associated eicosanoid/glutathione metabolism (MAPEG) protein n=1 Tax=Penicillium malachiteum TaxID=1324776 RepID=UPI0025491359|nr:Membrane-associated eicosanoid/glutathione metabolism (MAPEG) protein [Penicillium malachiteum]KAJ5715658.1 Membrane-associated eicosanoid/glutathione metabolism (MAPEG) protein [Penicillium malachiteum]